MVLDNDTRGWIMACVSGIACCVGASVICVDLIAQRIPRWRNFRIQDSNTFLSSSLSLSFGVMLFSSLYGMLPSSKDYLVRGGLSPAAAAYTLIGCFLGGVVGIQLISRLLHHYIPSHVVDCDHTHEDNGDGEEEGVEENGHHGHDHLLHNGKSQCSEYTPLLSRDEDDVKDSTKSRPALSASSETTLRSEAPTIGQMGNSRPSLPTRFSKRVTTLMSGSKSHCDDMGPCYGYSNPCSHDCFKALTRDPTRMPARRSISTPYRQAINRASASSLGRSGQLDRSVHSDRSSRLEHLHEENDTKPVDSSDTGQSERPDRGRDSRCESFHSHTSDDHFPSASDLEHGSRKQNYSTTSLSQKAHHHHVPSNAFLSIGLQTSIAIALHKLPEGFITYATNHANPKLGFAVFMALFIHNITEGFAMALPLYLAFNSRVKAMFWSSLLGGFSQPLGAGIAVLWLKAVRDRDMAPQETVYGILFSVTAGIMASVALSLFSESLTLTHNKGLCVASAFVGMGILGISFALTAG